MTSRKFLLVAVLAALAVPPFAAPVFAQADADIYDLGCAQLWYERNAIYKARGYCFVTERAIRTFGGNAGCFATSESQLDLSPIERRRIAAIVAEERRKSCR